jgi:hypothetical protein
MTKRRCSEDAAQVDDNNKWVNIIIKLGKIGIGGLRIDSSRVRGIYVPALE